MSVYVIGQVRIQDAERYADYTTAFRAQFGSFKGEVLVAEEAPDVLEGDWPWSKTVVLRFADKAEALEWYHSADYQRAASHRHASADCNLILAGGTWAGRAQAEAAAQPGA